MKLPDYKEKQRILYVAKKPAKDLIAQGDRYLAANRVSDALEFYQKVQHAPGLEKIKSIAQGEGDVMTYQQAMKSLNREPSQGDWNDIGKTALDKKKYNFALAAFEKSANTAMLDQINEILKSRDV
ncbi:MAG: hypothetical protein JW943_14090 [Deltaproteobacteria bacterium]|nr:hypothetical protein [Deltaproteobacteria bacterium]